MGSSGSGNDCVKFGSPSRVVLYSSEFRRERWLFPCLTDAGFAQRGPSGLNPRCQLAQRRLVSLTERWERMYNVAEDVQAYLSPDSKRRLPYPLLNFRT